MKTKQQERQITHGSQSLKSLSTSLVLIVGLGEIGSFESVLEWIASSCIECE
jgi:tRNA A37 threonylcarbamoyladenosine dehydratase